MNYKSLRGIKPRHHSRLAMAIQENTSTAYNHRIQYDEEHKKFQESDEGKRNDDARQILKNANAIQEECVDEIEERAEELKNNLYNFIVEELNYENRSIKNIEYSELEQIINECLPVLKLLKRLCNDKVIKDRDGAKNFSIYENLFCKLVALDARFAIFSPVRVVNKKDLQPAINALPAGLLFDVKKTKGALRKNEKADYVARYKVCEFEPENEQVKKVEELSMPLKKQILKTILKMTKVAEKMKDEIYNYFVSQIEISGGKKGKVTDEQMDSIILNVRGAKKKFEEIANNRFVIKKANWEGDIVEDLLDELQLLDPRIEFVDICADLKKD